ncbi:uncharacterized protein E0L32_006139 [Thyridium curvatum]|uniref:Uncharacterized protein n=1 Tax=Thyridium curvatum TaxID=1093900 RepID=A0A507B7M6_9PEZI|nr:uncharacterized protein E0L32_006139 [Thyridium curvatum]TPX13409.1 hypothetical protein E0L32_006139 [Thyridium curvatum]
MDSGLFRLNKRMNQETGGQIFGAPTTMGKENQVLALEEPALQARTNAHIHKMIKINFVKIILFPYHVIRQARRDYDHGRSSRKAQQSRAKEAQESRPQSLEGDKATIPTSQDKATTPPSTNKTSTTPPQDKATAPPSQDKATTPPSQVPIPNKSSNTTEECPRPKQQPKVRTSYPKGCWNYRHGKEYPWSIERVVQQNPDWRGTWVLEAKDMWSIDWQQGLTPQGKRQPQPHWPFAVPYETGSDELLEMLRRPSRARDC